MNQDVFIEVDTGKFYMRPKMEHSIVQGLSRASFLFFKSNEQAVLSH